jgi:hypothetical protein
LKQCASLEKLHGKSPKKEDHVVTFGHTLFSLLDTRQYGNAEYGWAPNGPVLCVLVWSFMCEIRGDFTYLSTEHMQKKPCLAFE